MDPGLFLIAFILLITFYLSRRLYKYLLINKYDNPLVIGIFAFVILFIVFFITIMRLIYSITGVKC